LVGNYPSFDVYVDEAMTKVDRELTSLMTRKVSPQSIQKQFSSYYKKKDLSSLPILTGLYFFHIQRWLKAFNRTNLMVIDGERFLINPGAIVEEVQDFLGLPKLVWKEDFVKNPETGFFCYRKVTQNYVEKKLFGKPVTDSLQCLKNSKGRTRMKSRGKVKQSTFLKLKNFYKPYNDKFFQLIGEKFNWD